MRLPVRGQVPWPCVTLNLAGNTRPRAVRKGNSGAATAGLSPGRPGAGRL